MTNQDQASRHAELGERGQEIYDAARELATLIDSSGPTALQDAARALLEASRDHGEPMFTRPILGNLGRIIRRAAQ
jgi:hypothetical protein